MRRLQHQFCDILTREAGLNLVIKKHQTNQAEKADNYYKNTYLVKYKEFFQTERHYN